MAGANLFSHINAITHGKDPMYWDKLDESDRRTWSTYMILRFLSMKPEWIGLISEVQPYLQDAPPRVVYIALMNLIPKNKGFIKYIKPNGNYEYENWIVDLVSKYYDVSKTQSAEYLNILYKTNQGKLKIKEMAQSYGTDPKSISKLKLGV
jgi:hypothetical protein